MREKHPIDERFKALYEAEISPPGELREALAGKLGWDQPARVTGTWSRWVLVAAGTAFLVTSGVHLNDRSSNNEVLTTTVMKAEQDPDPMTPGNSSTIRVQPPGMSGSTATGFGGTDHHVHRSSNNAPSETAASHRSERPSPSVGTRPKQDPVINTKDPDTERSEPGKDGTLTDGPEPSRSELRTHSGIAAQVGRGSSGSPEQGPGSMSFHSTMDADHRDFVAVRMEARPIVMDREAEAYLHERTSANRYVLPSGTWVGGVSIGAGRMNVMWKDADQAGLTEAERWRGSTIWGLDLGREWRSGWNIRTGLGLALDRSTFAMDVHEVERFVDVDTSWTQTAYNNTEDLIYSWNIDTVEMERPGATRTLRANNLYGAIRIPLTLGWHADRRRWRYGVFGGVTALIPSQRQGSTLYREADDSEPRVIDLSDGRVDDRFGLRVSVLAGVSLGFHITEHLTAVAEPMLSLPGYDLGRSGAAWMRGHYLQFRLQHAFGAKIP